MKTLLTWAGKSEFRYSGSVKDGTTIVFGQGYSVKVSSSQYAAMLNLFSGRTVNIGTSRTDIPRGSVGEWLQSNVSKTAIASYVGPILIAEGYAQKADEPDIRFY